MLLFFSLQAVAATRDEPLQDLGEQEASPLDKLLILLPENDGSSARRTERELFLERNISSGAGNIFKDYWHSRERQIVSQESENPLSSSSQNPPNQLFRPQKNPYPTVGNPSIVELFWGAAQPTSELPALNIKDLSPKECLVRISNQGKNADDPFWVFLQQGEYAEKTWIASKPKLMRSGETIKLSRGGGLRVGLWHNDNVPFVSEWIDLSSPGVELIYAPQAWTTVLPNWKPLEWRDSVPSLSSQNLKNLNSQFQNRVIIGIQRLESLPGGPSLLLCGPALSELPRSIITPKDWLDLAKRAKKNGQLIYLKGLQRSLPQGDTHWFPMALLGQAQLLQGVILWDGGDEEQYREWLQAGYPLGILADSEVNRGEGPVISSQRVYQQSGKEEALDLMRHNRVICVKNINFQFNLQMEATLDGNTVQARDLLGLGDYCEKEGIFLPKLIFECGPQARGIRAIELYRGNILLQRSELRQALREGRVHFAMENLRLGDVVTVVLEDVQGVRHRSNPIYFKNPQQGLLNKPLSEQELLSAAFLFTNDKTLTALEMLNKYQAVQNKDGIDSPNKLQ